MGAENREAKEYGMTTETAPVYVIGHKNPDTDSICSAIAYAELKNRLCGVDTVRPAPGRSIRRRSMC